MSAAAGAGGRPPQRADARRHGAPDGGAGKGILELRLQRLTGLEREKITAELGEVGATIKELLEILGSRIRGAWR
jgi:DNA gyrase/topoisomerase IV subunit A